ncbi:4-hydroxybenzoate octaprenyltransferase [Neiella marina]|uniref:4-hydroxybenzoate octaprenyltransferase n=1 Tax=Neiella holothuriorum TaxID=2870530 RepID=A0ABS7EFW3_9GAMM|nr:4-hydroxybenzoate octaprenyltransferase [Neiella holothuriorum]MBW8191229.1 4-hydroxybenzoate octaprenyltransferase [Neiella holothuriorum]
MKTQQLGRATPLSWRGLWRLCRLDKPVGILLLLWPTLWALIDASQGNVWSWPALALMLGVVLMRSAGCVINDYADRHWDGDVERTKSRPLVTGEVSPQQALILFITLCVCAFVLVLSLNQLTIALSVVAAGLATIYPFTKRITQLPQMVLGLAFSWAIPMAYAAVLGTVPIQAWWLFAANLCWTVAYDTQYAMVDRDDDVKVGIKSTAILFGQFDRLAIAILQLLFLICLIVFAWITLAEPVLLFGLLLAAGMFVRQAKMIRQRERQQCFAAFRANNWVGFVVAAAMAASVYWSQL